ncbi:hypothetical protein M4914_03705 [Streptomyces somaliensis DSM 40738]|nr:hypothetical protein [Streptomyces somaliensis DSM 40738]
MPVNAPFPRPPTPVVTQMAHMPPRGPRTRAAALAVAAVLALVPLAAACGGAEDASDGPHTPDLRTTTGAASPTATPTATGSPTATGGAPADPKEAEEEIRENWAEFFDPGTTTDERVRLLEDGERLRPVLAALGKNPDAAKTSARVKAVSFASATRADVTYDLLVGGRSALSGSRGAAVLQQDTWKVSRTTLCALAKLGGTAVPGC